MAVTVIDTIKPKNNGTFPVVEAVDVKVSNSKRLDAALNDKANQSDVTALQTAVAGKASQSELNALSTTVAEKQNALTETQLTAVNSGITEALVTQIGTNTTAIAGKASQADLTALETEVDSKADEADLTTATTNLQSQIDLIVTPVTQDAEVQNARVGADGTSYQTLKARLDTENEYLSTNLSDIQTILNAKDYYKILGTESGVLENGVVIPNNSWKTVNGYILYDGTPIRITGTTATFFYAWYSSDDPSDFIDQRVSSINNYVDLSFPEGTHYVRFSFFNSFNPAITIGDNAIEKLENEYDSANSAIVNLQKIDIEIESDITDIKKCHETPHDYPLSNLEIEYGKSVFVEGTTIRTINSPTRAYAILEITKDDVSFTMENAEGYEHSIIYGKNSVYQLVFDYTESQYIADKKGIYYIRSRKKNCEEYNGDELFENLTEVKTGNVIIENFDSLEHLQMTKVFNKPLQTVLNPRKNAYIDTTTLRIRVIDSPTRAYCTVSLTGNESACITPKDGYSVKVMMEESNEDYVLLNDFVPNECVLNNATEYTIAFKHNDDSEFSATDTIDDVCEIKKSSSVMGASRNPIGYKLIGTAELSQIYNDSDTSINGEAMQGMCSDGEYIYYYHDYPRSITKYKISDGTVEKATIDCGHGNDMTYNSATGKIYICGGNSAFIFVVNKDSLEVEDIIDFSEKINGNIVSIAYNADIDKYIMIGGEAYDEPINLMSWTYKHMFVVDAYFEIEKTYRLENNPFANQGIETDSRYIYAIYTEVDGNLRHNRIKTYDLNGKFIGEYLINTTEEAEGIVKVNDGEFYININQNKGGKIYILNVTSFDYVSYFDVVTRYQLN